VQGEFQILTGKAKDIQMKLNQWRHEYSLTIHGFQPIVLSVPVPDVGYCVLVERFKFQHAAEEKRPAVCTDAEIPEGTTAKSDTRAGKLPWEE